MAPSPARGGGLGNRAFSRQPGGDMAIITRGEGGCGEGGRGGATGRERGEGRGGDGAACAGAAEEEGSGRRDPRLRLVGDIPRPVGDIPVPVSTSASAGGGGAGAGGGGG